MRLYQKIGYIECKIRENKVWYIEYYQTDPDTGDMVRFRETYQLNRIKDLKERKRKAKEFCRTINKLLPDGFPFNLNRTEKQLTTCEDAIWKAFRMKTIDSTGDHSKNTMRSIARKLIEFLKSRGWEREPIHKFKRSWAYEYMDAVIESGVNNNTYNTKLNQTRSLVKLLVVREYLDRNPFEDIPRKRKTKKKRERYTDAEIKQVLDYYRDNLPWHYKYVLLLFYTWIRPSELRGLRFCDFDVKNQLIHIPADVSKNRKQQQAVTIPTVILEEFDTPEFNGAVYDSTWLVWGRQFRPGTLRLGKNAMNNLNNKILTSLGVKRIGVSFYSWKDTGMTKAAQHISQRALTDQARHSDPTISEIYYHRAQVNEAAKNLPNLVD